MVHNYKPEVRFIPGKGMGLVSVDCYNIGDTIFEEDPIVCAQFLHNSDFFPACSHCMKHLETPDQLLIRLTGIKDLSPLPINVPQFSSAQSMCIRCGVEKYCSSQCQTDAWQQYHNLMCVPNDSQKSNHPLERMKYLWKEMHMPPESSTIMLVVRMIAVIINRLNNGLSQEEAFSLFTGFKSQITNDDLNGVLRRHIEDINNNVLQSMETLVREAIYDPRIEFVDPLVFTTQGFRQLFFCMAVNGQGIGTSSLEQYQRILLSEKQTDQIDSVLDSIDALQPIIDEHSGGFTHCEGTGLYSFHSKLNHSCSPNAEIQFPYNSSRLRVVAVRPIQVGEEITIDYAGCCFNEDSDDEPVSETCSVQSEKDKRSFLRDFYLFDCKCGFCDE